jgi:glutathione S-transferase
MKVYGVKGSPFVAKALVALEEKGIPYQLETMVSISPKPPELLALHPLGKIPVLRDGEVVVPDSSVICAYLEKKFPSPALYPDEPADLAKALFLEEYADTRMFEVLGPILFERFVKPFVMKQETDEVRVAALLERELPPVLDYVESQLPADRETVLPRFGIADVALGAQLGTLSLSGVELDTKRWPRTAHYQAALLARPSFKTAMPG